MSSAVSSLGFITRVDSTIASKFPVSHSCLASSGSSLISLAKARMSPIFTPNWFSLTPFLALILRICSLPRDSRRDMAWSRVMGRFYSAPFGHELRLFRHKVTEPSTTAIGWGKHGYKDTLGDPANQVARQERG